MADRKLYLGQDEISGTTVGAIKFNEAQSLTSAQQETALNNISLKQCVVIDIDIGRRIVAGDSGTFSAEQLSQLCRTDTPLVVIRSRKNGTYYNDFYIKAQQSTSSVYLFQNDCDASQTMHSRNEITVSISNRQWTCRNNRFFTEDDSILADTGIFINNIGRIQSFTLNWSEYTKYDANPAFIYVDTFGVIAILTTWDGVITSVSSGDTVFDYISISGYDKANKTLTLTNRMAEPRGRLYCLKKQKGA